LKGRWLTSKESQAPALLNARVSIEIAHPPADRQEHSCFLGRQLDMSVVHDTVSGNPQKYFQKAGKFSATVFVVHKNQQNDTIYHKLTTN
jgi:hypothetical protein